MSESCCVFCLERKIYLVGCKLQLHTKKSNNCTSSFRLFNLNCAIAGCTKLTYNFPPPPPPPSREYLVIGRWWSNYAFSCAAPAMLFFCAGMDLVSRWFPLSLNDCCNIHTDSAILGALRDVMCSAKRQSRSKSDKRNVDVAWRRISNESGSVVSILEMDLLSTSISSFPSKSHTTTANSQWPYLRWVDNGLDIRHGKLCVMLS